MNKDKGIACPHCGLIREQPLGHCPLCIEPTFRAETARAFVLAIFNRSDGKLPLSMCGMAVACADELIAELAKETTPPGCRSPSADGEVVRSGSDSPSP